MLKEKNFAIILSGCGYLDGAEINEAVILALNLDKNSIAYDFYAPNREQTFVVNHMNGEKHIGKEFRRNIMLEAARIARGKIQDLVALNVDKYDALILPGGFGVMTNLSSLGLQVGDGLASRDASQQILPEVARVIVDFYNARKAIGALCIAPCLVAAALKEYAANMCLTLGQDNSLLEKLGVSFKLCQLNDIVIDAQNKIVSSPAFMYGDDANLRGIDEACSRLVRALVSMC